MKKLLVTLGVVCAVLFLVVNCNSNSNEKAAPEAELLSSTGGAASTISVSYEVPANPNANASDYELAEFAWNEFFALNWKAETNFPSNKRGEPDKSWQPSSSDPAPELTVWETYVHRKELVQTQSLTNNNLFTGSPDYYTYNNSSYVSDPNHVLTDSTIWNLLDEDNEISSCYLFHINGTDTNEVLYMAKANLVEYGYLRAQYPTETARTTAKDSIKGKLDSFVAFTNQNLVCAQDTSKTGEASINTFKQTICLPCGDGTQQGAIEIKTAWRPLLSSDNLNHFIHKKVAYFEETGTTSEPVVTHMVLIGMHIIHKTRNYPAFVYATWEHESVRDGSYTFISLNKFDGEGVVKKALPRIPPAIPAALQMANDSAHAKLESTSPWLHYRLTGVQGTPIDFSTYQANPSQYPNYFMANTVIESDSMLTAFHGSFPQPFDVSIKNIVWQGQKLNMGGCQGCHGRAAFAFGQNFSFLLDAASDKPDVLQTFQVAKAAAGN